MSEQLKASGALPLLDTDVLRSFVAIAECGSFTRAAQQVFRTPSALSMQIKGLEATLGQTLFVREARQVRLTPEGEVLLSFGRRLLKLNEEAVAQFLSPTVEGKVRFGTPDDIGTHILPGLLAQFARTHPGVQVDVVVDRSTALIKQLDNNELDLTLVTAGNQGQDPHRGEVVHTEPLVWVGREGGVAIERTPLPISLAAHGCCWRSLALTALDEAGIDYRIAYTSIHCAGQEAAMTADLAVSAFPLNLVKPPLIQLRKESGLPPLGDYQVLLIKRDGIGSASEALGGYVKDMFNRFKRSH